MYLLHISMLVRDTLKDNSKLTFLWNVLSGGGLMQGIQKLPKFSHIAIMENYKIPVTYGMPSAFVNDLMCISYS